VLGTASIDAFEAPAPEVLRSLSEGTGVPVEQLAAMSLRQVWQRLMEELERLAATPDGRAELERQWGIRWSRNS
jgi:hypothetical protein